jgi:hypothetical protein
MKVLDLIRYDPIRECFVLKNGDTPRVLNPWDELRLIDRPSIFLKDVYFRAKGSGTIASEEGLGYKLFGTYSKARQPNKHEGNLEYAETKAPRATDRTTDQDV